MSDELIYWYQLNPEQRAKIAARYKNVPLTSLNVNVRTHNLLKRYNPYMDVEALLMATDEIRSVYQLGPNALAAINQQILALLDGSLPIEVYTPPVVPQATLHLLPDTVAM